MRHYITTSSSIAMGQMIVLFLILLLYVYTSKSPFKIKKDTDSLVIIIYAVYIFFKSAVTAIFNIENTLPIFYSLSAQLVLFGTFYIARNISLSVNFRKLVIATFVGGSLMMLYYMTLYYINGVHLNYGVESRSMDQRLPITVNYILLMLLLFKNDSFFMNIIQKFVFAILLYFLILSYSKGAYLLLLIDTVLIAWFIKFKFRIENFILLLATFPVLYFMLSEYMYLDHLIRRFMKIINILYDYKTDGSTDVRVSTWVWIIKYLYSNPIQMIFGTGNNIAFYNLSIEVGNSLVSIRTSESQYFDTLLRYGLVGLLLEFTILFRLIWNVFKLEYYDIYNKDIYLAFKIFFYGLLVFLIFEPSLHDREFGIFIFVIYGLLVNMRKNNIISSYSIWKNR